MKNVKTVLQLSSEYLQKHKVKKPRMVAEYLLSHFLECKRIELYMHHDRPLEEKELVPFREGLKRKVAGEPLEYILGEIEFYHCKIAVNPSVLIPRQETEILLDLVCKRMDERVKTVLDLCTGSGCLAIGLKKAFPHLEVTGVDISESALSVAKQNAEKNNVTINFLQGDLFQPVCGKKFDLVLCNPPYVSEKEFDSLEIGVKNFEPKEALVSGPTGYEFFERLSRELPQVLQSEAKVFFEIGSEQGTRVLELFSQEIWHNPRVECDWAGQERFFSCSFP